MKLVTASAFVSIPDGFKPASFKESFDVRRRIFVKDNKYICLYFRSSDSLYAKECGIIGKSKRDEPIRLLADSSVLDGPAIVCYHDNGNLYSESWASNGTIHRDSAHGPAQIKYNQDGSVYSKEYRNCGRTHRPRKRGPALFYKRQKDYYFGFWEDGVCIAQFAHSGLTNTDKPLEFFEDNFTKEMRTV